MIGVSDTCYNKSLRFDDKNVVVTGGLGLIGREVCRAFAEHHATVVAADVAGEEVFAQSFDKAVVDKQIFYQPLDISTPEGIEVGIKSITERFGQVHVWVNAAYPRTADWGAHIQDVTFDSWDANIRMHLGGYFWSSKMVLEQMKSQGGGSLINFGSTYGFVGPHFSVYEGTQMTMPVAYAAIKGAITNLTRYFAALYGPYHIRVNTIVPGGVYNGQDETFVKQYSRLTPLGRMAEAREMAMPTVFLASEAASYITGHALVVDGGWTTW